MPVVNNNTRLIILGSLPGEESLRLQRYYANPRNNFWRIIFRIFNQPLMEPYDERISFLKSKGIGLWDVIHAAERIGSLDSKIRNETANDFAALFRQYPDIKILIFNGRKAQKTFDKFVLRRQDLPENILLRYFPSTSPAHSRSSFEEKFIIWRTLKEIIESRAH